MFPIKSFFTKDQFPKKWSNDVPLFRIAYRNRWELIEDDLKKFEPNYAEPKYHLTALHVAAMVGDLKTLDYLLNTKRAQPDPQDKIGMTPLAYAYLRKDAKALEMLQTALKTHALPFSTFEVHPHLEKLLQPSLPQDEEVVIYFKENAELAPMTAKEFQQMTGAQFCCNMYAQTAQEALYFMANRLHVKGERSPQDEAGYKELDTFLFSTPPQEKQSFYLASEEGSGLGLFAQKELPKGVPCLIYGGCITYTPEGMVEPTPYSMEYIDASKMRNEGAMINLGFPNGHFFEDKEGVVWFVPFETIKPGTGLYWNYSANYPLKGRQHRLLNQEGLRAYLKEKPLEERLKAYFSAQPSTPESYFALTIERVRLEYIVQSTQTLLLLLLEDEITLEVLKQISRPEQLGLTEVAEFRFQQALSWFEQSQKWMKPIQEPLQSILMELWTNYSFDAIQFAMAILIQNEILVNVFLTDSKPLFMCASAVDFVLPHFFQDAPATLNEKELERFKEEILPQISKSPTWTLAILASSIGDQKEPLTENQKILAKLLDPEGKVYSHSN